MKRFVISAALAGGALLSAAPAGAVPYTIEPEPLQTPMCIALKRACDRHNVGAVCKVWRQHCMPKFRPVPGPVLCLCPDVYQPVCGVNGVTYPSACGAYCARVPVASVGMCGEYPLPVPLPGGSPAL